MQHQQWRQYLTYSFILKAVWRYGWQGVLEGHVNDTDEGCSGVRGKLVITARER